MSVEPASRDLLTASLAVAIVKTDDQGNVRLVRRSQHNKTRDNVAATLVLAPGAFMRWLPTRPSKALRFAPAGWGPPRPLERPPSGRLRARRLAPVDAAQAPQMAQAVRWPGVGGVRWQSLEEISVAHAEAGENTNIATAIPSIQNLYRRLRKR